MLPEYDSDDDVRKSFEAAYEAIRERVRKGGPGWVPKVKSEQRPAPEAVDHGQQNSR